MNKADLERALKKTTGAALKPVKVFVNGQLYPINGVHLESGVVILTVDDVDINVVTE